MPGGREELRGTGMRLFVAVEIPAAARQEIAQRVAVHRAAWPPARWVRPEVLHMTLVFLGDVAAERVPALADALARAVEGAPPRRLAWSGAGSFPEHRPARVLWLGCECAPDLRPVHEALVAAARSEGLAVESAGSFAPHVTLARCPDPWPRRAVDELRAAFAAPVGEPFAGAEAVLFESHLGRVGARHEVLRRLPFAGAAC